MSEPEVHPSEFFGDLSGLMREPKLRLASVCNKIIDEMDHDAEELLDGKPFDHQRLIDQFSKNMAANRALAAICKAILEG